MKIPLDTVRFYTTELMREFRTIPINQQLVLDALNLHEKYRYNYWDCLMIIAALKAGCTYLFSEDMQNGQVIENTLTIKNIFAL